jgi:Tol biopolymer transport system component
VVQLISRLAWVALAVAVLASLAGAGSHAAAPGPALVFSRGGDLYAIALDGSRTVRLTSTPVWDESSPAPSPDGRALAYARGTYGSAVWVMDLAHRERRSRLTAGYDSDPTWTRDGRWIYFSRFLSQDDEGPNHSFHEDCGSILRVRPHGREGARAPHEPTRRGLLPLALLPSSVS